MSQGKHELSQLMICASALGDEDHGEEAHMRSTQPYWIIRFATIWQIPARHKAAADPNLYTTFCTNRINFCEDPHRTEKQFDLSIFDHSSV